MINSIRKGKRAEREAVRIFRDFGLGAERTSPMQASGSKLLPDVNVYVSPSWTLRIECKADGSVPKYIFSIMENDAIDILMLKRTKKPAGWLCVLRPELLVSLLKIVREEE